jgi:hypothetical protein
LPATSTWQSPPPVDEFIVDGRAAASPSECT